MLVSSVLILGLLFRDYLQGSVSSSPFLLVAVVAAISGGLYALAMMIRE